MDKALVIKTEMMLSLDVLKKYQKAFAEQLKTGVVLIPAYFDAELINVPRDVEVIIMPAEDKGFLDKEFHIGEKDKLSKNNQESI